MHDKIRICKVNGASFRLCSMEARNQAVPRISTTSEMIHKDECCCQRDGLLVYSLLLSITTYDTVECDLQFIHFTRLSVRIFHMLHD